MIIRTKKDAFTLIELLTVMAIITLLIGILTPALGAARDRAKATAVRAQLNAMEVGLDAFANDADKYPPSNANLFATDIDNPTSSPGSISEWEVGTAADSVLQGAHLLVDALVGRDFLGYDPKAPNAGADSTYNRWIDTNDRRKPYIPPDGVDVTSVNDPPKDGFGTIPTTGLGPQPTIDSVVCRVFRDKFGFPILYYRANPTANQNTPIISASDASPAPTANYGNGVYDGVDNEVFTSYDTTSPANARHRITDANVDFPTTNYNVEILSNQFAEFIRSLRATTYDTSAAPIKILKPRPVKFDRFILLSAGKDGIYGNLDDVANFQVLSTER